MATRVPHRTRVAVDALAGSLALDARVLEVGCGTGVAAALLCALVPDGHVTALDRSPTAAGHAERRLARWLAEGTADVVERDLLAFHGDGRPYDVVLAVDVNVFWTTPAHDEAARLRDLVADDGVVHLWFDPPGPRDGASVVARAAAALRRAGLDAATGAVDGVLHVEARPAAASPP